MVASLYLILALFLAAAAFTTGANDGSQAVDVLNAYKDIAVTLLWDGADDEEHFMNDIDPGQSVSSYYGC
jgi:hypothetical protein